MDDCASLVETMMQWISSSPTARDIDREVGDLRNDLLDGSPVPSYLRYNVSLAEKEVSVLHPGLSSKQIASLGEMDNPNNLDVLLELSRAAAEQKVSTHDFPAVFDLKE